MAIIEISGYKYMDGLMSDFIVVEENRINEYISYINDNNIKCVAINVGHYRLSDISFLSSCPEINRVSIYSPLILDYSGLSQLDQLTTLYCDEPTGKIDFSIFHQLTNLSITWNKNIIGLDKCHALKNLSLTKYKSKCGNLEEFEELSELEELSIIQGNITSLIGCENFYKLSKLELSYLRGLKFLEGIEEIRDQLVQLRFESCKNIQKFDYLSCLTNLELLAISNCGSLSSISFITKLKKLESFTFVNTNIIDGDLSPCLDLKYVGFIDKKHYSHSYKDINKLNSFNNN